MANRLGQFAPLSCQSFEMSLAHIPRTWQKDGHEVAHSLDTAAEEEVDRLLRK